MAKNIAPVMGMPMNEVVKELKTCKPEDLKFYVEDFISKGMTKEEYDKDQDEFARYVSTVFEATDLTRLINPGTCATKDQIDGLLVILKYSTEDNKHLSLTVQNLPFFQTINSFRLECNNCLNDHCKQRDPAHPVSEALKRVPEKK